MKKEHLNQFEEEARQKTRTKNSKIKLFIEKLPAIFTKRNLLILFTAIVLITIAVALKVFVFKPVPKKIYEVAVQVRSQQNSNREEDIKNSLKSGDVLLAVAEEHKWSKTEQVSYLILKMNLTEDQVAKLTSPEEKEIEFKDLSKEEQDRIDEEKKLAEEEGRDYAEEPHRETVRMRGYFIDLSRKEFESFTPVDLLRGQPYETQVYDWEIVKKKGKVN